LGVKCPACQSENPPESRYCHRCGSAIGASASQTLSYAPLQEAELTQGLKFNPGDKFGDRYTIIEEIGRGGMGVVYKAEDHELGITVVLKMIRPELSSRPGMIDHFRKETLLGRSISHENVVRIHDLGEVNKIRYISMDFVKGENLCEFMQTAGTLTLSTCLRIALQVCRAVEAAHRKKVIHQDLKPQNIMIDSSGKVYVTDFGLARSVSVSPAHHPGERSGTPKYFSPEQARGEESDERSDIYSLGVILYEMVTGAAPFVADTPAGYIQKHISEKPPLPTKTNPGMPQALEKIILKCLEKEKEHRYQNIGELLNDLELQEKLVRGAGARVRSRKLTKSLMAAALLLFMGVVIFELYQRGRGVHPQPRAPGRTSVAVMYAVNNSGDKSLSAQLRWGIPYYLAMDLAQSKYLSVLPQDSLQQVLLDLKQYDEERHLSKTLSRISEKTNVEYFVLPSFTKVGDNFWISFTIRKAKTDTTVGEPDTIKGERLEDVLSMVDELSAKVKSRLSLSEAEIARDTGQRLDKITTSSLEAVRYYIEAERYYIQSDFRASIQALERAVREDPNYALAYLKMAEDYIYLGEYDKHRECLQKALTLVDRVSERDRYLIQGRGANELNVSPLQAIEIYKKFIDRYPDDEEGYIRLGAIYRNLEEWEPALTQFERVLALNPKHAIALENKTHILAALGRYAEAAAIIEADRQSFLDEPYMLRQLCLLYLIRGRYDRAMSELERALARLPDNLAFMALQGALRLLSGDLASARRVFERLQQRGEETPDSPELKGRFWLAYLDLLQGKYRRAETGISEGIALAQKSGRVYDELELRSLLAFLELNAKRYSEAAEGLKPILEISDKTVNRNTQKLAQHLLGLAALGQGQVESAKKIGEQLHELVERTGSPHHMRHYEHLMGQIALAEGRPGQAVNHFEQAITELPQQMETADEHAFYYDGLAAAYYKSGNLPKAVETYKNILSLTTGRLCWGDTYARSFYWLGKIYQRTGNNTEARTNYESFLRLWENADSGLPEVADAKKQLEVLKQIP
jgi:serine/threonine protein kinase/Tfp pilus assembly protein PilF